MAIPATGAISGTPALSNAKDVLHTAAWEVEALAAKTSETTLMA